MKPSLEEFKGICARSGLRATTQRWEIFRRLRNATDHPDAETIFRKVKKNLPSISLDTVYRTLDTFEKAGIAARVTTLCDRARFDGNATPHPHAVCTLCGDVRDVVRVDEKGIPAIPVIPGFSCIHSSHIEYRGICEVCSSR
jgi:Fur family peroxide stress response transcriptional regulator